MTFRPRNAYYLRISTNIVLPLYLYLDERHMDWMSDVVLQHVLADLRPLIVPKLQAEKDVHFGPGAAPGNKRGTVEVHRGECYQFAYFFRKTEPHTVLFKSRYFVAAPRRPHVVPVPASPPLAHRNPPKKRSRTRVSAKQSKRKRAKTKGKPRASQSRLDEDSWSAEESEQDTDAADPPAIRRAPRPVRTQRRVAAHAYQEDQDDDVEDDVAMVSPPPETNGRSSSGNPNVSVEPLLAQDAETENVDPPNPVVVEGDDGVAWDGSGHPSLPPGTPDIELVVEEEEMKPKPLLKLKYQSFPISGHSLCVVVEPWPLQRAVTRLQSDGLGTSSRRGILETVLPPSDESVKAGQRATTPLFIPDHDRAPSEAPSARERVLPPVPLFHDEMSRTEDVSDDDDLMDFSQALNTAGYMHANAADDDDDMDGAVLFGDADEVRELL